MMPIQHCSLLSGVINFSNSSLTVANIQILDLKSNNNVGNLLDSLNFHE